MKNTSSLFTLYIVAFVQCFSASFLYPVIPLYAAELGAPVSQVGLIVSTSSYVTALVMIPLSMLSDRFGRHKFLIAGLFMSSILPLLYPLATSPHQVIVIRIFHGLAQAAFIPVTFALAADLASAARRGESMGWFTMSLSLGFMAGPVVGGFVLNQLGFTIAFYGSSAIAALGLLFFLFRIGSISQSRARVSTIYSSLGWLRQRPAIAGIIAYMFIAFGMNTIIAYIPLYGKNYSITEAGAGLIVTTLFASSALFRGLAGRLSDKLGRKPVIICGLSVGAIGVATIAHFHGLSQIIAVVIFFGFGLALVSPSSLALVADLSPDARGLSMGIMTCAYQVGLAVGPAAMGFVAEISNFETMFLACGACLACILLVIIGLLRAR